MKGAPSPTDDHTGHYRGRADRPMRGARSWPKVRHRYGVRPEEVEHTLGLKEVAAGLAVHPNTLTYWVLLGWVNASWVSGGRLFGKPAGGFGRYVIEEEEVLDFLADPRSRPYVVAERIVSPIWREWALECRAASPWRTAVEAGAETGYNPVYLSILARKGHLRRLRFRNAKLSVYNLDEIRAHRDRERWLLNPPSREAS